MRNSETGLSKYSCICLVLSTDMIDHSVCVRISNGCWPVIQSRMSITLCYHILHFTFLPHWIYCLYYTFLPHFNSLYVLLLLCHFNSLYIPLLFCHSICLIIHKMFYTLILLSVIYFRYTTYSISISSISDESWKLPDDGRPLPKHVGACIFNKGVVQFSA
jgi:hypothetical protein